MVSSYTTNKNIEKPGSGDYANTWDSPLNADLDIVDKALGGELSLTATGVTAYTLTASEYQNLIITVTGVISADVTYTIPSGVGGMWIVRNETTDASGGPWNVYIKCGTGASVGITRSANTLVYSDGTDIRFANNSLTAVNPVFTINDADGVVGGNASSRVLYQADGTDIGYVGFNGNFGIMYVTSSDGPLYFTVPASKFHVMQIGGVNRNYITTDRSELYKQVRIVPDSSVGAISSSTMLHVASADSGLTGVNVSYDDLVVESSGNTGITIAAGSDTGSSGIAFADPDSSFSGYLYFNHDDESFRFISVAGAVLFYANNTLAGQFAANADNTFYFNSGYGSAAAAYGCRAWVNFNGSGTVAIRDSGGVTSITDNGTGDYTINFSFTMPDTNYSVVFGGTAGASGNQWLMRDEDNAATTSALRVRNFKYAIGYTDNDYCECSIFR